jgi:hypothetical protein
VLTDAPSDRQVDGMDDYYRRSADALTDQRFIISEVRKRFPQSKMALVSTNRGTVTVGNVLRHAPELADLYALTSPDSIAKRHPGLADLGLPTAYEGRALVVSNQHDICRVSNFADGEHLAERNHPALIADDSSKGGGDLPTNCGGHSLHGLLGIKDRTLDDING